MMKALAANRSITFSGRVNSSLHNCQEALRGQITGKYHAAKLVDLRIVNRDRNSCPTVMKLPAALELYTEITVLNALTPIFPWSFPLGPNSRAARGSMIGWKLFP
jgi:hypothetical protein